MDLTHTAALVAAGIAAGVVNAVAGGGSLITFPTLIALGLDPVAANVTNSVAVTPGYLASVAASRRELAVYPRPDLVRLVPTAIVGTLIGCVVLLATPQRAFELVVPFLVLAAAVVLALQERLRRHVGEHSGSEVALHVTVGVGAIYGGYFGAALGVMMVAALGLVIARPLGQINALKNAISAVVGLVTVAAFALYGPVDWARAAVLAPACLIGGYLGARLARRLPARALRAVIVVVGLIVGTLLLLSAH